MSWKVDACQGTGKYAQCMTDSTDSGRVGLFTSAPLFHIGEKEPLHYAVLGELSCLLHVSSTLP